jgi:hypothetical protein
MWMKGLFFRLMLMGLVILSYAQCFAKQKGAPEGNQTVRKRAPFRIPPSGKPELLVGEIDFEAPSALAFDSRNIPYMFHSREPESFGTIYTLRDGKWMRLSYLEALKRAFPDLERPDTRWVHALGTITIDDSDGLYAIVFVRKDGGRRRPVLLYSPDRGKSFQVYELPGNPGQACLEVRVGHNDLSGPPAIGLLKFRKAYPTRWTSYHRLSVLLPAKKGGRLELGEPITITEDCFGMSNHSGGYSFAVTTGRKTHLTYAEIPKKRGGGNPTYVATIDRGTRKVIAKRFLVTATPKKADVHSTPVIAVDGKGRLHVVAGSHGQHFYYLRSLKPDTIEGGWTDAGLVGRRGTYATLVCDRQDTLHTIYRVHPKLFYQHRAADAERWSKAEVLVRAPKGHKEYTIFYHRLFMDRADAIYLSFTFFEMKTKGKGRYPRALALSEDGGRTWKLATTATFLRRRLSK